MPIYGTALLSICLIAGLFVGQLIGMVVGVDANVGGVGIAMLLLILASDWLRQTGRLKPLDESGITFWSSVYIPIVVAMAASQNVVAAVRAGMVPIVAGAAVVVLSFALVPLLSRVKADDVGSSSNTASRGDE